MAYKNYLLFNNIFLKNLCPSDEEVASANYLVHESARDWYHNADFSSPERIVDTWIRPLLNQQSLDLINSDFDDPNAWYIIAPWERTSPLALCYVVSDRQNLDGLLPDGNLPKGQHWMIRAVNLAKKKPDLKIRWIVLTNGDQWRLLDANHLRHYEAFLEIDLINLLKGENDRDAAYLFYRLMRFENSLERDEQNGNNKLDSFDEKSNLSTVVTENYLKTCVSDNLNTPGGGDGIMAQLCMGLVHAIDPIGKKTFTDEERAEIYRNATFLLYRLLFILYAEARNLLPMDREDYRAISLDRLIDEAKSIHQNPLQDAINQTSLWEHLDTLFSAIQYSDEYIGIPPYNGGLFRNDDKPNLQDKKIPNRFLAEALIELVYLPDSAGNLGDRIDYRDLSVRHLGSLYEGMIEYQLFIADEDLLARRDKNNRVVYLKASENKQKPNDEILPKGKVYFAQSSHERKATGTHYTAEDLVERLVKQTVLRLLDERWTKFEPKLNQWLKEIDNTPDWETKQRLQSRVDKELQRFITEQVLSLRICDPAMGSGHFLVHIAHKVTNFTISIFSSTVWENPEVNLHPDFWRKRIVENCLYGVDINEMAVELAKLSLWLATMQLGQPLSFLDHHLKQGNSLLGTKAEEIESLLNQNDFNRKTTKSMIAERQGQYQLSETKTIQQQINEAQTILQKIEDQIIVQAEDIHQQEVKYEEADHLLKPYKRIGDLLIAQKMGVKFSSAELNGLAITIEKNLNFSEEQNHLFEKTKNIIQGNRSFHWDLEFPRVFWTSNHKGFDVVIGNPPFLGGLKISGELGTNILYFLKTQFSPSFGVADLCAYFFRCGFNLISEKKYFGMVATNSVAQGDTRQTGLAEIINNFGVITYADRFIKWEGDANVEVNLVVITKNHDDYLKSLDGKEVPYISSYLDDFPDKRVYRLTINTNKSFQGDILFGSGFIISSEESDELIKKDFKNKQCIFPYLSGQNINSHIFQQADRYVICFFDWSLDKAATFPDLFKVVTDRVKTKREKVTNDVSGEKWWQFGRYRKSMRDYTKNLTTFLARSQTSEYHMLVKVNVNQIFSSGVIVFAFDDYYHFALLQSWIHEIWLRRQASTLESRNRYTPTDCFQTFPFPQDLSDVMKEQSSNAGRSFYEFRQSVLSDKNLGLTKTYNLFNDPNCLDEKIKKMQNLQEKMDYSILACYGWNDIDLRHNFYPNDRKQIRFMPAPDAQREIFTRLITLNQEIAAQEAAQGLIVTSENNIDTDRDDESEE